MIDTHTHLNFSPLRDQIDEIIARSQEAGLTGIIIASSSLADSWIALDLARKHRGFLWASVGIHPQKTDADDEMTIGEQLSQLEKMIQEERDLIVALGETGLDFAPVLLGGEERSREEQEELFLGQIKLALKYDLPLIIHARKANDEVIEILKNAPIPNDQMPNEQMTKLKGVFHCYSGGKKRIAPILDLPGEWYFGFDGNLTYDPGLQNVVAQIPRERLLLETDAPFLAPEPYRGQTCYPYYLPLIAKKVAEVWGINFETVAEITQENTCRLFSRLRILAKASQPPQLTPGS